MKISSFFTIVIVGLLFAYFSAKAHQPNFINQQKEVEIKNPEISQAFYGFLDGQPITYSIKSSSPFTLYTQLLTPDIATSKNNLFLKIKNNENGLILANLDGLNFKWERWYEEYGGDWYWKGPEFKKNIDAGTYLLTISNPSNTGEYVLVVGETESFPASQMPKMFSNLLKIKTEFFKKPWYSVFQNKIGGYLGLMVLILIAIITGVTFLIKFIKNKKTNV